MTARQFHALLASYSPADLWNERAPLIMGWLLREIRWPGAVLAAIGAVWLSTRRRRELLLLAGSGAAVVIFAMDYDVYDVEVFLILPMVVTGLIAGIGMQRIAKGIGRAFGNAPAVMAALAVLWVPFGQFRANISANNHHRHTFETEFFDRLFRVLPPGSAIVSENYPVDHMVLYKLIGERAGRVRGIELIDPDPAFVRASAMAGRPAFAFEGARHRLEGKGIRFRQADLPIVRPRNAPHIAETESPSIAFPLSQVVVEHPANATLQLGSSVRITAR